MTHLTERQVQQVVKSLDELSVQNLAGFAYSAAVRIVRRSSEDQPDERAKKIREAARLFAETLERIALK